MLFFDFLLRSIDMRNYYLESKIEQKNKTRIITLIILIIVTTIVVSKINNYNNENFYEIEGTVIDTNYRMPLSLDKDRKCIIRYKYEVEGNEYTGSYFEKIKFLVPKIGSKIKIKYDKEDYSKSKPNLLIRYIKHATLILVFIVIVSGVYKISKRKV